MDNRAQLGDGVRVQCSGLPNKRTAGQKQGERHVLKFRVGSRKVIPGISVGVIGMAEGEEKRLTLKPTDAFGPVRNELIQEISRDRLPPAFEPRVGKWLASARAPVSRRTRVKIVEVTPSRIVVDGNHPLAGKILELEIQLISLHTFDRNTREDAETNTRSN